MEPSLVPRFVWFYSHCLNHRLTLLIPVWPNLVYFRCVDCIIMRASINQWNTQLEKVLFFLQLSFSWHMWHSKQKEYHDQNHFTKLSIAWLSQSYIYPFWNHVETWVEMVGNSCRLAQFLSSFCFSVFGPTVYISFLLLNSLNIRSMSQLPLPIPFVTSECLTVATCVLLEVLNLAIVSRLFLPQWTLHTVEPDFNSWSPPLSPYRPWLICSHKYHFHHSEAP